MTFEKNRGIMSIEQQQLGNVHLIRVNGRLDHSQTPQLEDRLTHLLEAGHYFLVTDLTQTDYINSGGLRCLVSAWRKARQQQGNLVLCGLNNRLQEIFNMVGFDKVFQIFPDYETARQTLRHPG
ncbi:MAG: STAS domain-containing protein [Ardenticatenaceae bacterium]|nr:STAS domain-containing protein [Ardenticatenaceae bacterium]